MIFKRFFGITTRRFIVFLFDLFAVGVAYYGAFLIRFDFKIPPDQMIIIQDGLPLIFFIQSTVFIALGLYRGIWAFTGLRDLFLILRAIAIAVGLSIVLVAVSKTRLAGWPRSVFLLDAILLVLILGGARFSFRFFREKLSNRGRDKNKRILIIGAGYSANLIMREFSSRPELSAHIVGFLDDNRRLIGSRIHGCTVLGTLESLSYWLKKYKPNEVIIAIPSLPGNRVKAILTATQEKNISCRICPPIRDILLGHIHLNQLREVRVEDLLRREIVCVDDQRLEQFLVGRTILVTGAGGSIGSELCRQVLKYNPASLILYERSEFNLYRFEKELRRDGSMGNGSCKLSFVIGDVLDRKKLRHVLKQHQPDIVIHAAAYKHVPMMEENVYEAINNNVVGTYVLINEAIHAGVKNFVLISTDKAVRPSSAMGATKRIAELVCNAVVGQRKNIQAASVRFGNVLDSEGSVLPLFREQINQGGPVTVTHPEVTRYFMTIPEASALVLQAAILGKGGEVFILDMGKPVLIRELAEELIQLSGLKPYEDIEIAYTGLRKGEKLYEELLFNENTAQPTTHPKVLVSTEEMGQQLPDDWELMIQTFMESHTILSDQELRQWIKHWIPEFTGHSVTNQIQTPETVDSGSAYFH